MSENYPGVSFCGDPGLICDDRYPNLRYTSAFFSWKIVLSEPGFDFPTKLTAWVNAGMPIHEPYQYDRNFIDELGGLLNQGNSAEIPHGQMERHQFVWEVLRAFGLK